MVLIHLKNNDTDQFLFETTCAEKNDELIKKIVEIWNMRFTLSQLASAIEELAKHGPSKPPDKRGLDDIEEEAGKIVVKGPHYQQDPLGNRTGNPPSPELQKTFMHNEN